MSESTTPPAAAGFEPYPCPHDNNYEAHHCPGNKHGCQGKDSYCQRYGETCPKCGHVAKESSPMPSPQPGGFEPWWDSAGREVHWCPKYPGLHHGVGERALFPRVQCADCGRVAASRPWPTDPPESATLPQDAPGVVGTATETKTPSVRKGEAVAATGEGGQKRVIPCNSPEDEKDYECHECPHGWNHDRLPGVNGWHVKWGGTCPRCGHVAAAAPTGPERVHGTLFPTWEERAVALRNERDAAREEAERLKASVSDLMRSQDSLADERDSAVATLAREQAAENLWVKSLQQERDKLKAELANAAKHRDHYKAIIESVQKDNDKFCRDLLDATGVQSYARTDGSIGFIGKDLTRRSSRMRRIIKWSLISALLLGNVAHVVPLSSVYEAATFESKSGFLEFQVCSKCAASRSALTRDAGEICPACGSREFSRLVGREVTRAFLGVWPRETRWTAEGEIAREAK